MPRGRRYSALSQKIAQTQKREQKLEELEAVSTWIQVALRDTSIPFSLIRGRFGTMMRLAREVGIELSPELIREVHEIDHINQIGQEFLLVLEKLTSPRTYPKPVVVQKHICIECKKKEAHFGDYCKRCADKLGIRPKGKVGLE